MMKGSGQDDGGSRLRWAAVMCLCVGWALAAAAAAEDLSEAGPGDADPVAPIKIAATVGQALAYNQAEQADLNGVTDGDDTLAHPALYVLLCRAAGLPDEDELLEYARPVAGMDLLANPSRHRGALIDMHVRIWRVSRWADPTGTPTRGWGLRPAWRLDCKDRATDEPVIVLVTELPGRLGLGEQDPPVDDSVLGLFYKVVRLPVERPAETGAATKLYPVLAAKTLYGTGARSGNLGKIVLAVLLVVLIIGYILAKRSAKVAPVPTAPARGDGPADAPVDEDLVRAVAEHKHENSEGDST